MHLSVQQRAAQRNLSYVLAEKLSQRILACEFTAGDILPGEVELGEYIPPAAGAKTLLILYYY